MYIYNHVQGIWNGNSVIFIIAISINFYLFTYILKEHLTSPQFWIQLLVKGLYRDLYFGFGSNNWLVLKRYMVAAFFFLMKRGNERGGKPTANTNTVHAGRVDD